MKVLINIPYSCAPYVAHNTIRAIVASETRFNPIAINLNKPYKLKYRAKNIKQAINWVNYLERHRYNFDVGLAQINIYNIHKYGYRAAQALNSCINLQLMQKVLQHDFKIAIKKGYSSDQALIKTISAYNTGNYYSGLTNGYVARVIKNANY